MGLPIDGARHLRVHFPPDEDDTALRLLDTAVLHDGTKRDARNVVVEGEDELIEGRLVRVRKLVEPIPPSE